jgi:hypothetical protein
MLKDRLKRFRRKRTCASGSSTPEVSKRPTKSLGALSSMIPQVLPGEDKESYARHCKKLIDLSKKKSPSMTIVSTLME